jgi:hypothetical protein
MTSGGFARTLVSLFFASLVLAPLGSAANPLTGSCSGQQAVQPFLPWLDSASYVLVGGGTFESNSPSWQTNGATTVAGNEPFYANAATDIDALSLPAGSSAVSTPLCTTLLHPTLRFFVRNTGNPLGQLEVEAIADGISVPIALVLANGAWQPSLPYPILLNALAPLNGGQANVSFRFTAQGGDWTIDDVYVDPYESR